MITQSRLRQLFLVSLFLLSTGIVSTQTAVAATRPAPMMVVVDADTGVDDAVAIAYLLSVPDEATVLGITAVAGNTTVENAANNDLLLLDTAHRNDIPVVVGAGQPLVLPASHQGMFINGPDGLWFVGLQHPHDLSGLSHDAPGFLRDQAVAHPGATLLALGPLTNVAQAIQQYPSQMHQYAQIVWMGGSKVVQGDGNTPVSVFNPWFDPDAAKIVLQSGIPLTLLTADAGRTMTISDKDINKLANKGTALGQLLAPALQAYSSAVNQSANSASSNQFTAADDNRHGRHPASATVPLYDPTAAVVTIKPQLGTPQSGLVIVQTPDGVTRGQTIIGLTIPERIQMIATDSELSAIADQAFSDPNFNLQAALGAILARQPDNAQVILTVDTDKIKSRLLNALLR